MSPTETAKAPRKEVFSPILVPERELWRERVDNPDPGLKGVRRLLAIWRAGGDYSRVILDVSEKEEIVAAALLARRRNPPALVLADATWERGKNPLDRLVTRVGVRLVDGPHVRYGVHSSHEREVFAQTWGVDPARVVFTPRGHTLSVAELEMETGAGGGVFAGGVSLRDYATLVEAMRGITVPLLIATRNRGQSWTEDLPPNIEVRQTSPEEFNKRTAAASVVVVPLEPLEERGAGQTTYLNAMAMGKPVIVTDVWGARDYIRDGETAIIVPPHDPAALREALLGLLENPERARRMGEAARRYMLEHLTPDGHVEHLLSIVDEAWAALQEERASGRS
jgi:glycosyltransferase involved in cell wall biosynthesis